MSHQLPRYPVVMEPGERRLPDWRRSVTQVVNSLRQGKLNSTGTLTLNTSTATTTLTLPKGSFGVEAVVLFDPRTQNAATELYGATMFVSNLDAANQEVHITHASNTNNDRTFQFIILG